MARRIGCAVALLLLVLAGTGTALVWLLLSATGAVGSPPFARVISGVVLLLGIGAVLLAALGLRRLTAPATRIVQAAQRVESGDYSARVPVRGTERAAHGRAGFQRHERPARSRRGAATLCPR
ncbi:MAG: HAMP domain-containing protein [Candidatus Dormibacter sp.]